MRSGAFSDTLPKDTPQRRPSSNFLRASLAGVTAVHGSTGLGGATLPFLSLTSPQSTPPRTEAKPLIVIVSGRT